MSKIETLIQQYCPNGVEYKTLGECCCIEKGKQLNRTTMIENGKYPVYNGGVSYSGFYNEYNTEAYTIIISQGGASAGFVNYIERSFWAGAHCYVIKPDEGRLQKKFLYYVLKNGQNKLQSSKLGAGIPGLNTKDVQQFQIPVPPFPVQEEIVKILDTFTKLEAELEAELEARRKQYEYYRNTLLDFTSCQNTGGGQNSWIIPLLRKYAPNGVAYKTLREIGPVCMCKRILKSQTNSEGGVPFYKIGTFGKEANAYISQETFEEYRAKYNFPKKGDILISAAGTIGRTVVYDGKPAYFQDSNIVWIANDETKVLNTFLYYCYTKSPWKVSDGGTISRLYNDNILNAAIPVPPLPIQEKIVEVLDKFDALVNDLSEGLPAELAARRKQYEYYRDRLLTFKPL